MNKKFLSAAFCSVLSLGLAFGVATFSLDSAKTVSNKEVNLNVERLPKRSPEATELSRDELRVDLKSATATDVSTIVKAEFTSVFTQGFGATKKSAYIVVDSPDYTGEPLTPTYDGSTGLDTVIFNGYTAEIGDVNIGGEKHVVVPTTLTYGSSFKVNNTKIISGAMVLSNYGKGYMSAVVIPKGITTIEAGAFSNVGYAKTEDTAIDSGKTYYKASTDDMKRKCYVPIDSADLDVSKISQYYEAHEYDYKILCEAESKPAGWEDGWATLDSSKIEFGYTLSNDDKKNTTQKIGNDTKAFSTSKNYILGYVNPRYSCPECKESFYSTEVDGTNPECPHCLEEGKHNALTKDIRPEYNLPLTVSYDIVNSETDEFIRKVTEELPVTVASGASQVCYNNTQGSPYSRDITVLVNDGEKVDYTSFKFSNIFVATTEIVEDGSKKVAPDTTTMYCATAKKRIESEININEIINYSFADVKKFGEYTMASMNVDRVHGLYEKRNPDLIDINKTDIASGKTMVRLTLQDLSNSQLEVDYVKADGSIGKSFIKIVTPNPIVPIEKDTGNVLQFLFKNSDVGPDFSADKLRSVKLINVALNLHLWVTGLNAHKIAQSDDVIHFGSMNIMPTVENAQSVFAVDTFIIIFAIGFSVLYAAGAVALFFYMKEKFKNDEFRRIKPKNYVKTSVIGFLGSLIVVLTILFIIFRFGVFNNSVAVNNPIDVFVVIFGVVSVVVVGYFIKYVIGVVKTNKKRKENKRLKLNEDVADDGTN